MFVEMGNCTRKIENEEYVKMYGDTDMELLPSAGNLGCNLGSNWEVRDEETEKNYLGCGGTTEFDDDFLEKSDYHEYHNFFDEMMDEHPEWFIESGDINSDWEFIGQDDHDDEKHVSKTSSVNHNWVPDEKVIFQMPSYDNPPMKGFSDIVELSSLQNLSIKDTFSKPPKLSQLNYNHRETRVRLSVYDIFHVLTS